MKMDRLHLVHISFYNSWSKPKRKETSESGVKHFHHKTQTFAQRWEDLDFL